MIIISEDKKTVSGQTGFGTQTIFKNPVDSFVREMTNIATGCQSRIDNLNAQIAVEQVNLDAANANLKVVADAGVDTNKIINPTIQNIVVKK